jgi:hypothetical protein
MLSRVGTVGVRLAYISVGIRKKPDQISRIIPSAALLIRPLDL